MCMYGCEETIYLFHLFMTICLHYIKYCTILNSVNFNVW